MIIDPPFSFWDIPAILISGIGLALGVRLAYFGHRARGQWKRLVEAVIVSVLVSSITTLYSLINGLPPQPAIAGLIGIVAGIFGYWMAGRADPLLYGIGGALLGASIAMIAMWLLPIDLIGLGGVLLALGLIVGYQLGVNAHAWIVIFTTALAGAQWVGSSVVGVIQVLQGRSSDFIADRLLDFVVPVINYLFSLLRALGDAGEMALFLGGLALQAIVAVTGVAYQLSPRSVRAQGATSVRVWLKQSTSTIALYGTAGAAVYAVLFFGFRVHQVQPIG
jgi:hypothetical protein